MLNSKRDEPVRYGGQAVMEGVMMRGRSMYAMAVRRPDGEIEMVEKTFSPASKKYPILKLPIIRGVAAFVESLATGIKTMTKSAEIAVGDLSEEEPNSKFEKFLTDKFGEKLNGYIMNAGVVIAFVIAIGLFMLLPAWIGSFITPLIGGNSSLTGIFEGLIRVAIFVGYIFLISRSKDIRRVFAYHGAEHKTINCFEAGAELTSENVAAHSRFHKRCGTSFLLVVMLISMLVFLLVRTDNVLLRFGSRIALLPVIAGLAYEISVKWAGRRDNALVRAVIFPGMCLQRLTTAEPDEKQIETAVAALAAVLEKEQPEHSES